MRKRLITPSPEDVAPLDKSKLDLGRAAVVEVTSEDKDYQSALLAEEIRGWRADSPGTQTIRLIFDKPQRIECIALVFEEIETERTQEFVLRWSEDGGRSFRDIVRQRGCHAENHSANTFISIGFETRSRTVALRIRCRFSRGLGLYRFDADLLNLDEEHFLDQYPVGKTFRMELRVRVVDENPFTGVSEQVGTVN